MTTFTRRPTRYLIIGALAALISTNLQFSAQATPTAIAIVMEVPDYPGKSKLTKGVENSSVKKVQEALIELGYEISTANGKYGPSTTKAISAFYKDLGDIDDGTSLGKIGWTKVFEALDEQRADEKVAEQVAAQPIAVDPAMAAILAENASRTIDRGKKTKVVKLSKTKKKVVARYQGDITLSKDARLYRGARELVPFEVWRTSAFARFISMKESHRNCKAVGRSGKYRGRWQMSPAFWKTYGGKQFASTPDKASCRDQDLVAYNGWIVRGWAPWAY
jgi:peptidoglycan hydrolase-like protein with peptidoglycan-binding domain